MRILLAEDSALMREGLAALLERAGHDVVAPVDSADALRRAVRYRADLPDLVVTDVRMPPDNTDDGLRAAVAIRIEHPRLPILLLSQWLGNEYLGRIMDSVRDDPDAGGVGYLLKDRVGHVREFMAAVEAVAAGGIVVGRKVVAALMDRRDTGLSALTDRERDVLRLLSAGETNQQIARTLHVSEGAVVKYVSAVFDKLDLSGEQGNRRVLAVLAYLRRDEP
ncbi:DNA-binding NarL/FixJ family response regulator [Kineosphaera limosa]|uniref:Putative two-component response regulator n=1 Tax=Kineosphaera limosa NBRC 100340 TaxID=1184609 RepID=K6WBB1_9MICO|nr:response regulator transcription factor [Kineosphaera limosa]NYD99114.1 DNA-binding NarL/FixJ family response regulator [Kineosphaera limosa]GAB96525.1 putative two-component response regulator [Kineosphaera limosa NBRC 100340]